MPYGHALKIRLFVLNWKNAGNASSINNGCLCPSKWYWCTAIRMRRCARFTARLFTPHAHQACTYYPYCGCARDRINPSHLPSPSALLLRHVLEPHIAQGVYRACPTPPPCTIECVHDWLERTQEESEGVRKKEFGHDSPRTGRSWESSRSRSVNSLMIEARPRNDRFVSREGKQKRRKSEGAAMVCGWSKD